MNLNDEQKQALTKWVSDGLSLADIQKRLADEFELSLTYMDVRFLVDDLNLQLADRKSFEPAPDFNKPADDSAASTGKVSVTTDKITQPGAVISGSVTFSDGKTSAWALDQFGRVVLEAAAQGYKPAEDDLAEFQQELSRAIEKSGY